ncbi:MAG: NAD-dependent epimerase/dehydratase family protein [Planctomycetota bacterium]
MKVLILGGTGFLGGHTVRAFRAAGHEVAVLVRPGSPRELLDGVEVEWVEGDLRDADSLLRACQGREVVVHQAGVLSLWEKANQLLYDVNVLGTRRVVNAALAAGVRRLVYTGSVGIYAGTTRPQLVDEAGAAEVSRFHSFHVISMCLAEAEVYKGIARGLDAVLLHPTLCLGEGDRNFHSSWAIVGLACLRVPVIPPGGINVVDVLDVARTHVVAAERAPKNRSYILGGENLTNAAWAELLRDVLGMRPLPPVKLGGGGMHALGDLGEWLARVRGVDRGTYVTLNHALGRAMSLFWFVDDAKAVRELGHEHSPVRAALERQIAWLGARGQLPGQGFGVRQFAETFFGLGGVR